MGTIHIVDIIIVTVPKHVGNNSTEVVLWGIDINIIYDILLTVQ